MASMGNMEARFGMLVVETIARIRRAYFVQKKPIKAICRKGTSEQRNFLPLYLSGERRSAASGWVWRLGV